MKDEPHFAPPHLVPELLVADLDRSLAIYVGTLGFRIHVRRPEEKFAYLIRDGAHVMLEQLDGPGRRFTTGRLEHPLGRGVNFQIAVANVDALYASVWDAGMNIVLPIEERWYRHDRRELGNRQFVVADPDGYLLRFFGDLGMRRLTAQPAVDTQARGSIRRRGFMQGQIRVPADFNTMGAAEIEAMFYGE